MQFTSPIRIVRYVNQAVDVPRVTARWPLQSNKIGKVFPVWISSSLVLKGWSEINAQNKNGTKSEQTWERKIEITSRFGFKEKTLANAWRAKAWKNKTCQKMNRSFLILKKDFWVWQIILSRLQKLKHLLFAISFFSFLHLIGAVNLSHFYVQALFSLKNLGALKTRLIL